MRQFQRITETEDLRVCVRCATGRHATRRVLNISQGGMLVAEGDLPIGELAGFELAGPWFQYAGTALVAHRTEDATGLRFLSWQGPAGRPLGMMIAKRAAVSRAEAEFERRARLDAARMAARRIAQRGTRRRSPSRRTHMV